VSRAPGRFAWKRDWAYDDRKPCSRCEEVKFLEGFTVNASGFLGHSAMCRACSREERATAVRRKRIPKNPTAHMLLSDEMRELYDKMVVLSEDDGPVCANGDESHKELWFAPHNTWEHLVAKGYCHGCPVLETCLDLTVLVKPQSGIWAGLNPSDRRVIGQNDRDALLAEFEYQKHNGAHMPSYRRNHKPYHRWDRSNKNDDSNVE